MNNLSCNIFVHFYLEDFAVFEVLSSACMCMCMYVYVNSWRFFLGAPAAFYIGTGHPMGNISRRFFRIFEIFIFGRFIAKKGSKLTPKRTFSLNHTAFFSG